MAKDKEEAQPEINIDAVVNQLKQGAAHYRAFADAAAIAEGVLALKQLERQLEVSITKLKEGEAAAAGALEEIAKEVDAAKEEATGIIADARNKAKKTLDEAAGKSEGIVADKLKEIAELDDTIEKKQAALNDLETALALGNEELEGVKEQVKQFKDKVGNI